MLTIRDLTEQFDIQGAYCIKEYDEDAEQVVELVKGVDFEYEHYKIADEHMNREIIYMYAVDGVLNIEIE